MFAYRFLAKGAVSSVSGFPWPVPDENGVGAWVGTQADATVLGVFAHRARDLPHWIEEELWQVELRGEIRQFDNQVLAEEARLLRKLPEWDEHAPRAFATSCAERLRSRAVAVFNRHGLALTSAKVQSANLADCPALLRAIEPALHGEAPKLAAEYLDDAITTLSAGQFGSVAYIAHVASIDARVAGVPGPTERQLQAEWLRILLYSGLPSEAEVRGA